jgi:hypothetical protein
MMLPEVRPKDLSLAASPLVYSAIWACRRASISAKAFSRFAKRMASLGDWCL